MFRPTEPPRSPRGIVFGPLSSVRPEALRVVRLGRTLRPPPTFIHDLTTCLHVWRAQPLLPFLSVVVWTAPVAIGTRNPVVVSAVALPLLLFSVGWPGTERFWYARAFVGQRTTLADAWSFTWSYFGRFLRLGLILAPLVLLSLILLVGGNPLPYVVALVAGDVAFTFVTPALAFTTRSVIEALRLGIVGLRNTWPGSAPYALFPSLTILVGVWFAVPSGVSRELAVALAAISALLNLALKGATAAFYLRVIDSAIPAHPSGVGGPQPVAGISPTVGPSRGARVRRRRSRRGAAPADRVRAAAMPKSGAQRYLAGSGVLLLVFVVTIGLTGSLGFQRSILSEPLQTIAAVIGLLALAGSLVLFVAGRARR